MAIGSPLSDFVGYSVGVPTSDPPATVGYVGALDFVMYSVGIAVVIPPTPPTPIITVDDRRWPGPPITLYRETDIIPAWQRKREDDEIMIL